MIAEQGAVVSACGSVASETANPKCLGKVTGSEFPYLNNPPSLVEKQSCSQEGDQLNFSKSLFPREGNPWVKSSGLSVPLEQNVPISMAEDRDWAV